MKLYINKEHKARRFSSSLYPQLAALKLDPDLDGRPPSHPSVPPPYNSTTANGGRETDHSSPTRQRTSPGTASSQASAPPQDATGIPSSQIAHRLRNPNQDITFNMPMIEVSGPDGATLVFRAWTSADITAAST